MGAFFSFTGATVIIPSLRSACRTGLFLVAAGLCACASTSLDNSWKNPEYRGGRVGKVLVAGISTQASVRRVFEDTFVDSLRAAGVDAVASYTLIPEDGRITPEKLKAAVDQSGAHGVLITRLLQREAELSSVPPARPTPMIMDPRATYYHGYYNSMWSNYYEPPSLREFITVVAETTLFSADDPQPVWSGTTRTPEPENVGAATKGFAKVIIAALKKEGLI